jgi:hypothetical protein
LLALEREELVSIAYREALIVRRLTRIPLDPAVRELIRHALVWAWKDEEMHAIYIRGAIFKLGPPMLKAIALARQIAGALGGWSTAIRQHVPWSERPLSRSLATAFTGVGLLLGLIPGDVREHLRYGPFRRFCVFNAEAERTAWLCYSRLLEVVSALPNVPAEVVEDIRRVQADEQRHQRIFELLAAALDEQDRLLPGESVETLSAKIAAVGDDFLPWYRRTARSTDNSLATGGPVWVVRGDSAEDKLPLFRQLLAESGLAERLAERARALGRPLETLRVVIKPAFMLGYHRADLSPITDQELVRDLGAFLSDLGCRDVAVVEARNVYDCFYAHRTVLDVARYFGLESPHYRIVDLSEEQVPHAYVRGMGQYTVGRTWQLADFRIAFGKLRSHPVDQVYLSLGAVEAAGTRCDQFMFAERQAERYTALMMVLGEFPPHFALLDAYDSAADGLCGMMGCPRPPAPRRLYAAPDALSLDLVAARHARLRDPARSPLLRAAFHWFGDPSAQITVHGLDEPLATWRDPYHNEWATLLSLLSYPVYELGSGRGALFVPEMDQIAFPALGGEHLPLRAGRTALRALVGLRR